MARYKALYPKNDKDCKYQEKQEEEGLPAQVIM